MEELKKNIEGIESAEKATAVLIDFAKEKGFDFTAEDIAELEAEAQKELSGEELDKVNAAGTSAQKKTKEKNKKPVVPLLVPFRSHDDW